MGVFSKAMATVGNFFKDQRASMSIVAALSAIPMILAGGAAIDLERAINARTALRASLDSAALYAASFTTVTDTATLTAKGQTYINANYLNTGGEKIANFKVTNNGATVTASADVTVNTIFMGIVGTNSLTMSAASTVTKQGAKLEVAMVLDNTGSMSQSGKLPAEISASTSLLNQLKGLAKQPGDVYVSVVPFVDTVNVGSGSSTASWVGWDNYMICSAPAGYSAKGKKKITFSNYTTSATCTSVGGVWGLDTVSKSQWTGCVTDRGDMTGPNVGNYDTNVVQPATNTPASLYPATQTACPAQVMGLSYDWTSIQTLFNNMAAGGTTNQNIGLEMGWMSLVGGGPFSVPALDPNSKYQKAVVLLTDGLNTQDRWYTDQASIDARQQLTCANVKSTGTIVYTVQIDIGSVDGKSPLLQTCASDSTKYFYLTDSTQVLSAFTSIGNNLANMYISQ